MLGCISASAVVLCRHEQEPVSYTETCDVPDAASIEATLVPPTLPSGLKASGLSQPPQSPPVVTDATCNKFLPNDSTEDRFIWVIRWVVPTYEMETGRDALHVLSFQKVTCHCVPTCL